MRWWKGVSSAATFQSLPFVEDHMRLVSLPGDVPISQMWSLKATIGTKTWGAHGQS